MSAAAIRVFGIFTLLFDALLLVTYNRRMVLEGHLPSKVLIAMAVNIFLVAMVGVGLLLLRKWAAAVFALALVVFPTWMTLESIGQAPGGFYFMMLAAVIVFTMAIIVIFRSWPLLSWRGKWLL